MTKKQKLTSFKSPTLKSKKNKTGNQSVKSLMNESAHLSELVDEGANQPKTNKHKL